jgi:hypothetical protein
MTGYSFHKGETWVLDCQFEIQEGDTLQGVSFRIVDTATGATMLTQTVGSGVVITDATAGTATVTVLDSQQATFLPTGRYRYEAKITTGSGVKEVQGEGPWVVLPSLHAA